ncbi:large ribosomal subunit protein mL40-like [Saccoglossus kowalevskii]|uniref:Large ribosomal subunit protein mL40 n=1 Tax=Saccoglossus kowalevskii TaxID=10224 RepID=A0ABM0MQA7_SACKO|nr:PREDICTED: 39S ribosomal protein L40, mitochondrial-like [Saccoglossus kowalevskii]
MATACVGAKITQISVRLLLPPLSSGARILTSTRLLHTGCGGLNFHATPALLAEPPKKKKKQRDMAKLDEAREKKRQKRVDKMLDKMGPPELKTVEEFKVDKKLLEKSRERILPEITFEESETRALLQKEWSKYKFAQHLRETKIMERFRKSQEKALQELKKESVELYEKAMLVDSQLLTFEVKGPVNTPYIKGYDSPIGEYIDISKDVK